MPKLMQLDQDRGTVTYPCLVIHGLEYQAEIDYFKNLVSHEGSKFPLYYVGNNGYEFIGDVDLTHRFLISLKQISKGDYKLELLFSEDTEPSVIDYMDINQVIKCLNVR